MNEPAKNPHLSSLRRFFPLALLIAGLIAFFALRLDRYLSLSALAENRILLLDWVTKSGVLAPLVFLAVYAVVVATSVPGGAVMTIAGGFLFGTVLGTIYSALGATIGAAAVFLAARTALGEILCARAAPFLRKMEAGFRDNAVSYMLHLRLVPLYPFWLVNLVPALLGVPFAVYIVTTVIGILPGTVVYSSVGNGLGALVDAGQMPDIHVIFKPSVLGPLLGLGLLSLVPVFYRKFKARRR